MSATATQLKPGAHRGVSFVDYCLDPGINASTLKAFAGSTPKHARLKIEQPDEDTASMAIGHAAHTAILEPELFDSLYAVYPKADYVAKYGHPNSNAYKAARYDWEQEHEDAIILDDAQHDTAVAIRDAVRDHPLARALLIDNKGRNELTIISERDGDRLKARIDRLTTYNGFPAVVDLKTIATRGDILRPRVVSQYVARYAVHLQLAWYMDRLNEHAESELLPLVVFAENTPPHDVVVYPIDDTAIEQGRREAARYLDQLKSCRESGYWPGYSQQLQSPVSLPTYAIDGDMDQ